MNPTEIAKLLASKNDLETLLGRFEFWLLIFGVFVVIGVAGESVFGIRTWWNTRKLHEVERQLDQVRQAEIAEMNRQAGEAFERAGNAEENVAGANERAAKAEQSAAEANRATEQERIARLKIESQIAPRRISGAQEEAMKKLLKLGDPRISLFVTTGNPEVADFASDLERVFKNAGLTVTVSHGVIFGGTVRGITATVAQNRITDIEIVANALRAAGLIKEPLEVSSDGVAPGTLQLKIAPK